MNPTKENCLELLDRLEGPKTIFEIQFGGTKSSQSHGKMILLGDVLEKLKNRLKGDLGDRELPPNFEPDRYHWELHLLEYSRRMIRIWSKLNLSDSLQSILSEAVWEEAKECECGKLFSIHHPTPHSVELSHHWAVVQVPKQLAIRDLFTLLLQLFPKP